MSVYFFDLSKVASKNKLGVSTNNFWQNSSTFSFNMLINYVIYGDDTNQNADTRGHYAYGQIYIKPRKTSDGGGSVNSPFIIINEQNKEGITRIYSEYDDSGSAYILIDTPVSIDNPTTKYFMKCTVI